jgi:hypothetical protein
MTRMVSLLVIHPPPAVKMSKIEFWLLILYNFPEFGQVLEVGLAAASGRSRPVRRPFPVLDPYEATT